MDTVGTFEMAKALSQHNMITALHKHYEVEEHIEFVRRSPAISPFIAVRCVARGAIRVSAPR
jgi:GMP reductase